MARAARIRVSVLLVDDHAVVREGYRRLLERHGDIAVIGEAADAATAYSLFCRLDPQIVVMDITLPGTSGIEAMRRMLAHKPDARVLIFSMHEDAIFARRALQAGAFGYVTKASAPNVLVEAIHAVAAGKKYLSPEIAQKLALRDFTADQAAAMVVAHANSRCCACSRKAAPSRRSPNRWDSTRRRSPTINPRSNRNSGRIRRFSFLKKRLNWG